jgi:hypothetical protein
VVAATALAVFSDITRFPDAKHAASYAGIVPATYQSGDRDAHGRITKRGAAELRAMLCQAAHHARHADHPLHPYFAPLCTRRGYKLAVTAVAHRLCRIMFAMLRDGRDFDVNRLAVERGPFERKIVRLSSGWALYSARRPGHTALQRRRYQKEGTHRKELGRIGPPTSMTRGTL